MTDNDSPAPPRRKRPLGITLLSLLMGWLTLSALLNIAILPIGELGLPTHVSVLMAAYAITAGASTVGLWRMKPWALTAFRAWGAVCLGLVIVLLLFFQASQGLMIDPVGEGTLFVATLGVLTLVYWLMHRYIRRRVGLGD